MTEDGWVSVNPVPRNVSEPLACCVSFIFVPVDPNNTNTRKKGEKKKCEKEKIPEERNKDKKKEVKEKEEEKR